MLIKSRYNFICSLSVVLTNVSSQASVNLLVVLAVYRLYVPRQQFQTRHVRFKVNQPFTALSWLVSIEFVIAPFLLAAFTQFY